MNKRKYGMALLLLAFLLLVILAISHTEPVQATTPRLNKTKVTLVNGGQVKLKVTRTMKARKFLKRNKIFFDLFSSVLLGIMGFIISFVGLKISNKTTKIYQQQLEITENNMKPYFILERENIWEKVEETKGTDRVAKLRYTITNERGNISSVEIKARSYIYIYVPTKIAQEYHVFRCSADDFTIGQHCYPKSKKKNNRKFVFYEYALEGSNEESPETYMLLWEYLSSHFPESIMCKPKKFATIKYNDYMGKEQKKIFDLEELEEINAEDEGVQVGIGTSTNKILVPINTNNIEEVGKVIKENIEDWLKKNGDSRGQKKSSFIWHYFE